MGPQSKQVDSTQICLNIFLTDPSPGKALGQTVVLLEAFTYMAFWPRQLKIAMNTFFFKVTINTFWPFSFRNARRT